MNNLERNMEYLTSCTVNLDTLLIHLIAREAITVNERELVKSKPTSQGKNFELYSKLARKPNCLPDLLECLEETGNNHVAQKLRTSAKRGDEQQANLSRADSEAEKCENLSSLPIGTSKINSRTLIERNMNLPVSLTCDLETLLIFLLQKGVINHNERELVQSKPTSDEKNFELYSKLTRKPNCLPDLLDALELSYNAHVAKKLRDAAEKCNENEIEDK